MPKNQDKRYTRQSEFFGVFFSISHLFHLNTILIQINKSMLFLFNKHSVNDLSIAMLVFNKIHKKSLKLLIKLPNFLCLFSCYQHNCDKRAPAFTLHHLFLGFSNLYLVLGLLADSNPLGISFDLGRCWLICGIYFSINNSNTF